MTTLALSDDVDAVDLAAHVVAEDVLALEVLDPVAAVEEAADPGGAARAGPAQVLEGPGNERAPRRRRLEPARALVEGPAVVAGAHDLRHPLAGLRSGRTRFGGPHAALGVPAEAPRVAQAVRPDGRVDLGRHVGPGVALRDAVAATGGAVQRVDPQDLAEQDQGVLCELVGVVLALVAVARADVEHAVGAEGDAAALVLRGLLGDLHHDPPAARIAPTAALLVLRDHQLELATLGPRVGVLRQVGDVEGAVRAEARVAGHAEQAALGARPDGGGQVEEELGLGDVPDAAVLADALHAPRLFAHVEPVAALPLGHHEDRLLELDVRPGLPELDTG